MKLKSKVSKWDLIKLKSLCTAQDIINKTEESPQNGGQYLQMRQRLWSQGPSYTRLISSRYLSVELISALSSSIGVILAVPLTALIGAAFFGKAKSRQ